MRLLLSFLLSLHLSLLSTAFGVQTAGKWREKKREAADRDREGAHESLHRVSEGNSAIDRDLEMFGLFNVTRSAERALPADVDLIPRQLVVNA